jgi:hypothetical protein
VALYFLLLGFAFLLVEIAFIHRFSLFLGHPLDADKLFVDRVRDLLAIVSKRVRPSVRTHHVNVGTAVLIRQPDALPQSVNVRAVPSNVFNGGEREDAMLEGAAIQLINVGAGRIPGVGHGDPLRTFCAGEASIHFNCVPFRRALDPFPS